MNTLKEEKKEINKTKNLHPERNVKINFDELNTKHPQEKFVELFKTSIRNSKIIKLKEKDSHVFDNTENCINGIEKSILVQKANKSHYKNDKKSVHPIYKNDHRRSMMMKDIKIKKETVTESNLGIPLDF